MVVGVVLIGFFKLLAFSRYFVVLIPALVSVWPFCSGMPSWFAGGAFFRGCFGDCDLQLVVARVC